MAPPIDLELFRAVQAAFRERLRALMAAADAVSDDPPAFARANAEYERMVDESAREYDRQAAERAKRERTKLVKRQRPKKL